MITNGFAMTSILKVRNNTDNLINKVTFVYDSDCKKATIKRIKSNENKQTGISVASPIYNLRMSINDEEKLYLIKDTIPRGYEYRLIITISSFNSDTCEYTVETDTGI